MRGGLLLHLAWCAPGCLIWLVDTWHCCHPMALLYTHDVRHGLLWCGQVLKEQVERAVSDVIKEVLQEALCGPGPPAGPIDPDCLEPHAEGD